MVGRSMQPREVPLDERCHVGGGLTPASPHQPSEGEGHCAPAAGPSPRLDLPVYQRVQRVVVHGKGQGADVGLKPMVVLEPQAFAAPCSSSSSSPPSRCPSSSAACSSYALVKVLVREKARVTLWLACPLVTAFPSLAFPAQASAPRHSQPILCAPPGQLVVIKASRKDVEGGDDPYTEIRALRRLSRAPTGTGGPAGSAAASQWQQQPKAAQAGGASTCESSPSSSSPLSSGHVVQLLDAFEDEAHVYSVLPYVPGQDLCAMLMQRQEGLPEQHARAVMQQLVAALLELQQHGLLHGDVSLENLMATPVCGGKSVHVTLLDLGMASELCGGGASAYRGGGRVLRGKPSYLAPEAVVGPFMPHQGALDVGALDVWAVGVVLFILLTSCPLYSCPEDPAFGALCPQGPAPSTQGLDDLVSHYASMGLKRPSDGAMDLLRRLLHPLPSQRATLQQVAQHPWLAKQTAGKEAKATGADNGPRAQQGGEW